MSQFKLLINCNASNQFTKLEYNFYLNCGRSKKKILSCIIFKLGTIRLCLKPIFIVPLITEECTLQAASYHNHTAH